MVKAVNNLTQNELRTATIGLKSSRTAWDLDCPSPQSREQKCSVLGGDGQIGAATDIRKDSGRFVRITEKNILFFNFRHQ
jgi:hypothetical protein